jgi:hypothetical protein
MRDLCQRFGASRDTGYKMLGWLAEQILPSLMGGSRSPRAHPSQTEAWV